MTQPIRVLHVIGIMNRGGAETMIMNLYRNIDRTKVQFDFVENSSEPAAYDEEIKQLGGRIFRCPHFNGKNYLTYRKWWERFFREHGREYPIVHGHIGSSAAIYLREAKKHGLFTIAHSHSIGSNKVSVESILYSFCSYPTRFIADFFFACSRKAGISRYGRIVGNDNNKCVVLNNAIDTSLYAYNEETRCKLRKLYGLNESFVVGNVGRFEPVKNHVFMVNVFSELLKSCPDAKLMLVGDGYLRDSIEKQIENLGIRDSVLLMGSRDDVPQLLQAMDVFFLPSKYEGVPLCMVEAQTAGLPCLVSSVVSEESFLVPEVIKSLDLERPMQDWVHELLAFKGVERKSNRDAMISSGYDIKATAAWLCDFYINRVKESDG